MTNFRPKLWTSAGAAVLLGLSACGDRNDASDTDAAAPESAAATSGERGNGATVEDRRGDGSLEDASGQRGDANPPAPVGEGGEGGGEGGAPAPAPVGEGGEGGGEGGNRGPG